MDGRTHLHSRHGHLVGVELHLDIGGLRSAAGRRVGVLAGGGLGGGHGGRLGSSVGPSRAGSAGRAPLSHTRPSVGGLRVRPSPRRRRRDGGDASVARQGACAGHAQVTKESTAGEPFIERPCWLLPRPWTQGFSESRRAGDTGLQVCRDRPAGAGVSVQVIRRPAPSRFVISGTVCHIPPPGRESISETPQSYFDRAGATLPVAPRAPPDTIGDRDGETGRLTRSGRPGVLQMPSVATWFMSGVW